VSHRVHLADSPFPRNGWNDSRSSTPSFQSNDVSSGPPIQARGSRSGHVTPDRGGNRWSENRPLSTGGWDHPRPKDRRGGGAGAGYGTWKDGIHVVGERNDRLEKELFGDLNDPSKQHTGINFEKYDDIPVEATGAGVPDPITSFDGSPLDPVLLENITSAHYTTPTPVQKYSVPIVAAGRDLMACAQVCLIFRFVLSSLLNFDHIRLAQVKLLASSSLSFLLLSPRVPAPPKNYLAHTIVASAIATRLTPPP
jgi:ATP-dependent RNA helicase DDX3X